MFTGGRYRLPRVLVQFYFNVLLIFCCQSRTIGLFKGPANSGGDVIMLLVTQTWGEGRAGLHSAKHSVVIFGVVQMKFVMIITTTTATIITATTTTTTTTILIIFILRAASSFCFRPTALTFHSKYLKYRNTSSLKSHRLFFEVKTSLSHLVRRD